MRGLVVLVVAAGLVLASCSDGSGTTTSEEPADSTSSTAISIPEDTEHGIVSGVVNGDTVQVMIGDEPEVVRLAGVRAPQGNECYAAQASLALSRVTAGRSVALVGDGIDAEGTPIRYLIIEEDVPLLANVELVALGVAAALHGHELAGDFLRVNERAYASGRGMWGTFACGHPEGSVAPDRPQLRIEAVNLPSAGGTGSASVEIVNASYTEIAVGGWTMRDAARVSTFTFPASTVIPAGELLSVAMTCEEGGVGMAWCVEADLWSAGGNTLIIQDQLGNVVDRRVHEVEEEP